MTQTPFVNKDAQYLWDLAATFERDDLQTNVMLRRIAQNLENLDEKYRNLSAIDDYTRGVHDAYARVYERSNLAEPEEINQAMQHANLSSQIAAFPIKRVAPAKAKPVAKPSALAVNGIRLDLSALKFKGE